MMVVSPVRSDERVNLHRHNLCEVMKSIGTGTYGKSCLGFLENSLNVDQWALFRFRSGIPLKCVATASMHHRAAALENTDRYIVRCHSVDPCVQAANKLNSTATLTKLDINDIEDMQYRHCFELTQVRERLSLFSRIGDDFYLLSVFRGPRMSRFTPVEMNYFAALAELLLVTAQKHEILMDQRRSAPRHLDIKGIERLLKIRAPSLSARECEVCARAVVGKTIEGTSLDLDIRRTSVITYRQRAYQKLGISRTNELVALLNDMHGERALAS
ncbi:MAG TPA: LuxR C-terminal-related transcriptional regulator [Steroidobacteraceae bacterium]|jgi:DNA-binding CsgD family transcriptional regulator|nr:LuxR C-terminal-related transcriptional regulator [Steroidobacteraceae bacterium]